LSNNALEILAELADLEVRSDLTTSCHGVHGSLVICCFPTKDSNPSGADHPQTTSEWLRAESSNQRFEGEVYVNRISLGGQAENCDAGIPRWLEYQRIGKIEIQSY